MRFPHSSETELLDVIDRYVNPTSDGIGQLDGLPNTAHLHGTPASPPATLRPGHTSPGPLRIAPRST
ncbi:hypothetical protein ABT119_32745 [Streptomyces sp. NPDC001910]|uniref:hypothetical protein n=1 Tax=Streptomyces sp. NPDC001910 TaxID=3154403 RepID=UPI0033193ACD